MGVHRVVPNLGVSDMEASRRLYAELLGFDVAMDLGWIVTLVSPSNPTAQISLQRRDGPADGPSLTIEVDDVEAVYSAAARNGVEVVYPLTHESWGVRRFFFRDPEGVVVNVMSHDPSG